MYVYYSYPSTFEKKVREYGSEFCVYCEELFTIDNPCAYDDGNIGFLHIDGGVLDVGRREEDLSDG